MMYSFIFMCDLHVHTHAYLQAHARMSKLIEENKAYISIGGETDANDKFISPTVFDFGSNLDKFVNSTFRSMSSLLACF